MFGSSDKKAFYKAPVLTSMSPRRSPSPAQGAANKAGKKGLDNMDDTEDSGVPARNAINVNEKASYYVWFLGSKESRGLRGPEFVRPVVRQLLEKKNSEVVKLTLQVNGKGIKILQTPDPKQSGGKVPSSKIAMAAQHLSRDLSKQFVPHSSITCVFQSAPPHDDVVSCIFLMPSMANGVTHGAAECPLYVYSYRCDSAETAELLKEQLQALVDRPENQAKYDEIEEKLIEKGLLLGPSKRSSNSGNKVPSSKNPNFDKNNNKNFERNSNGGSDSGSKIGSDGRSLGRSSESSGASSDLNGNLNHHLLTSAASAVSSSSKLTSVSQQKQNSTSASNNNQDETKLVTLYDSLAAELREKLDRKNKASNENPATHPFLVSPAKDFQENKAKLEKSFQHKTAQELLGRLKATNANAANNNAAVKKPVPIVERVSSDDDWPLDKDSEESEDENDSNDLEEEQEIDLGVRNPIFRNHPSASKTTSNEIKKPSQMILQQKLSSNSNKDPSPLISIQPYENRKDPSTAAGSSSGVTGSGNSKNSSSHQQKSSHNFVKNTKHQESSVNASLNDLVAMKQKPVQQKPARKNSFHELRGRFDGIYKEPSVQKSSSNSKLQIPSTSSNKVATSKNIEESENIKPSELLLKKTSTKADIIKAAPLLRPEKASSSNKEEAKTIEKYFLSKVNDDDDEGQNQINKKRFSNEKPSNYLRRQVSQSKQLQPVAPQQSRRYEIKDDDEEDSDDHLVPVTHFGRNMEVVGEFEKVWSWTQQNAKQMGQEEPPVEVTKKAVGKTSKAAAELKAYEKSKSAGNRVKSPVERKARASPEYNLNPSSGGSRQRGVSSPAELRKNHIQESSRHFTSRQHQPPANYPPGLFGPSAHAPQSSHRRAMSPDLRRSASRVADGGRSGGFLRREKTSLFDSRYPSLDFRDNNSGVGNRKKSLYELQDQDVDYRRRSYHEMNHQDLSLINHKVKASGKLKDVKSKKNKNVEGHNLGSAPHLQYHHHPHHPGMPMHMGHHGPPPHWAGPAGGPPPGPPGLTHHYGPYPMPLQPPPHLMGRPIHYPPIPSAGPPPPQGRRGGHY